MNQSFPCLRYLAFAKSKLNMENTCFFTLQINRLASLGDIFLALYYSFNYADTTLVGKSIMQNTDHVSKITIIDVSIIEEERKINKNKINIINWACKVLLEKNKI